MNTLVWNGRLSADITTSTNDGKTSGAFKIIQDVGYGDKKTNQAMQCYVSEELANKMIKAKVKIDKYTHN